MKLNIFFLIINIFVIELSNTFSQVDYSNPKNVAQNFLDLCLEGKRIEASRLYGIEECENQISSLLQKMVMNDIPLKNESCKYFVDSCQIDKSQNIAKCYYSKKCKKNKDNKNGLLFLKMIDDKWLVEYTLKRDGYL